MKNKPIFVHISKTNNAGDQCCSPVDYIPEFSSCEVVNLSESTEIKNKILIIGGGGLLSHGEGINKILIKLISNNKVIFWGVGVNTHSTQKIEYPEYLKHNNILFCGIRDWKNPFEFVACGSCLSKFFIKPPKPLRKTVVYEHFNKPININHFPKLSNKGTKQDITKILNFLSSGEIVITNTYHGAYWSLLMNKTVLILNAFSNRFFTFPPGIVAHVDDSTWKSQLNLKNSNLQWFYDKCVDSNISYLNKIKNII